MRAGNFFSPADVGGDAGIDVPTGRQLAAIRLDTVKAVAGFVLPGKHVNVLAIQKNPVNPSKGRPVVLLKNMLVCAVNTADRPAARAAARRSR